MHLFFDLDNTLWDFDKNSFVALSKLHGEFQLDKKLNTTFEKFHEFYLKKNEELWHLYYFQKIEKAELRYKRFYDSFLNFGLEDEKLSKDISEAYIKIAPYSTELKAGAIETLDALVKKYPLHIITNGFNEVQHIKIDSCGLRKYFDQIIISDNYNLTKPNVEIFRLAESMAKAEREKCVMIGDSWISDVEGAIGAGWKAVYYNYNGNNLKHDDVKEIKHLNELVELIK